MNVKDVSSVVNGAVKQVLGSAAVTSEDLSNLVEIGAALGTAANYDAFTGALLDRIYKTEFRDLEISMPVPNVLMDAHAYGNIKQKVRWKSLPEAEADPRWDLEDGTTYDQDKVKKPAISSIVFNHAKALQVWDTIPMEQTKSAFLSADAMNEYVSYLLGGLYRSMQVETSSMVLGAVANLAAETASDKTGVRLVNLLADGKTDGVIGSSASDFNLFDPAQLRYALYRIVDTYDKMATGLPSTLFNAKGIPTTSTKESTVLLVNSTFFNRASMNLMADTFHADLLALPNFRKIPYWQGSGTDFKFGSTGTIKCTRASDGKAVQMDNVVAILYDYRAVGATNAEQKTTSHYNANGDFTNYYLKWFGNWFNDLSENCVVFTASAPTVAA